MPITNICVLELSNKINAGAIYDAINTAERFGYFGNRGLHGGYVANIGLRKRRSRADFLGHTLRALPIQVQDANLGSLRVEEARNRLPYSRGCPSYDKASPIKFHRVQIRC
ncbi:hypothetical protein AS026_05390 [Rhizobium altiplani]|uniref:Uncharacterized protein n=1 Tax=Rhizobium altiplani TaxID=1864509 RepID=A0A109JMZ4_9HYPH|nr:hypothetical protein AS026_05390 [Rhizobium altiplani]